MTKAVIFDADGIILKREMYFSQRLSRDYNIPANKIMPFFKNEFQLCETGKADLKEELKKYLDQWGWKKSIDDLLDYWFTNESDKNEQVINFIQNLRNQGIACYLSTNNEKYRTDYLSNNLKLKHSFNSIFSSAHIGYLKPQLQFWQAVYSSMQDINKKNILVWDNEQKNINSAKQFGFQTELYTDFQSFKRVMAKYLAGIVV